MTSKIEETIKWFRQIYLVGIPFLLNQNDTAFLSFVCVVAAIDALAGYRYDHPKVGDRFRNFVTSYFPPAYASHAANLYLFRCRLLHNFSPAYFSLVHASPGLHLKPSSIGDTILSDDIFFSDMSAAAQRYFAELHSSPELQGRMLDRLQNIQEGGAISVSEIT
jgi:hypothetical protein